MPYHREELRVYSQWTTLETGGGLTRPLGGGCVSCMPLCGLLGARFTARAKDSISVSIEINGIRSLCGPLEHQAVPPKCLKAPQ